MRGGILHDVLPLLVAITIATAVATVYPPHQRRGHTAPAFGLLRPRKTTTTTTTRRRHLASRWSVTTTKDKSFSSWTTKTPLSSSSLSLSTTKLHVHVATPFVLGGDKKNDGDGAGGDGSGNGRQEQRRRPSRPERKALERAQKQRRQRQQQQRGNRKRRKHNYAARRAILQESVNGDGDGDDDEECPVDGQCDLHSTAVSCLSPDSSTADDVVRAIKRAQNLHDDHDLRSIGRFLLEVTDDAFAYGYKGSLLARLAVAALHVEDHDLAGRALRLRRTDFRRSMLPMESAAIVRGLLRVHNVSDAVAVFNDELSLPVPGTPPSDPSNRDRIVHRARSLGSIASRHFFEGEPTMAVTACRKMVELGPVVREARLSADEVGMPWARLLRGASQCQAGLRDGSVAPCVKEDVTGLYSDGDDDSIDAALPCNVVYAVLDAMTAFPSANSDQVYELLSNALVRRVVFVTGAVNVNGCPPADRGEACFIGRSNVGKSSLVNMVTNRKSLAYTSKRPGKTRQFNFFAVNDKVGRDREIRYGDAVPGRMDSDSFHIVDLPGFGYARVPDKQRKEWLRFMREYICTRPTLRVVFHLIDARHGPTEEDVTIMTQMAQDLQPRGATTAGGGGGGGGRRPRYVVVLTKADKNGKGTAAGVVSTAAAAAAAKSKKKKQRNVNAAAAAAAGGGRVSRTVMDQVRTAMHESGLSRTTPLLLTSAETKLGRDDVWRFLRLAAEDSYC